MIFTLPFITGYEACIPRENSERTRKSTHPYHNIIAQLSEIGAIHFYVYFICDCYSISDKQC